MITPEQAKKMTTAEATRALDALFAKIYVCKEQSFSFMREILTLSDAHPELNAEERLLISFSMEEVKAARNNIDFRLLERGLSYQTLNRMSAEDRAKLLTDMFEVEHYGKRVKRAWIDMTFEQRRSLVDSTNGKLLTSIAKQKEAKKKFSPRASGGSTKTIRTTKTVSTVVSPLPQSGQEDDFSVAGTTLFKNGMGILNINLLFRALDAKGQIQMFLAEFKMKGAHAKVE